MKGVKMDKPNPTPLCPALMTAQMQGLNFNGFTTDANCIGSLCAKWVPEIHSGGGLPEPGPYTTKPTGRGWCADNLRRAPFADPAGGAE